MTSSRGDLYSDERIAGGDSALKDVKDGTESPTGAIRRGGDTARGGLAGRRGSLYGET